MKIGIRVVQTVFIVVVAILITSNTSVLESKIENTNLTKTVNLSTMAMKIVDAEEKSLQKVLSTYEGKLTSYVYNCPLCSGRLACMSSLDLSNGTTTYTDEKYGELNIVASSSSLPCGSVVTIDAPAISQEPIKAIVLDRGVSDNKLDLLVKDINTAYQNGIRNISYNVIRSGW